MDENMLSLLRESRLAAQAAQLIKSNDVSQRYGLSLTEAQQRSLITAEADTLRASGRLEFGTGILPRLIYAFCDSPYMTRETWLESLLALQELFYTFKNELDDALTDEELLEAMHKVFHGKAQGSLLYLENMATQRLLNALRSDGEGEEEDD